MPGEQGPVLTVGHSTRSLDAFLGLLHENGVGTLIDVRTVPRSRRHPHFSIDALRASLPQSGIEYAHLPGLGGLRRPRPDSRNTAWRNESFRGYADYMQTEPFENSLRELIELSRGRVTAIMCAEAVPWRCHRSLISDALLARQIPVEHILGPKARRPHSMTSFAKTEGTRVTYPTPPGGLISRED